MFDALTIHQQQLADGEGTFGEIPGERLSKF